MNAVGLGAFPWNPSCGSTIECLPWLCNARDQTHAAMWNTRPHEGHRVAHVPRDLYLWSTVSTFAQPAPQHPAVRSSTGFWRHLAVPSDCEHELLETLLVMIWHCYFSDRLKPWPQQLAPPALSPTWPAAHSTILLMCSLRSPILSISAKIEEVAQQYCFISNSTVAPDDKMRTVN